MGADSIQEPAVVRYNDGASGKILQPFFQRPERIHVDIIRRFVEEEDIRLGFQRQGEVQAVPLSSGKHAAEFLLV